MGVWIDRTVITIVVIVGLVIMYRALKEPLDMLFGVIGKGLAGVFGFFKDKTGDAKDAGYEVISYG